MAITAPYNFVPLSKSIFLPPWSSALAHDLPFRRGLSGHMDYVIMAHTPLLVSAGRLKEPNEQTPGTCRFFQIPNAEVPDARYAIPGSSLRGMTRNVLEIASFARMRLADDRRYGLRDLTNTARIDYRQPLQDVCAGWLYYDAEHKQWQIDRCEFARIHHDRMDTVGSPDFKRAFLALGQKRDARATYELWNAHCAKKSLRQRFDVTETDRGTRIAIPAARGQFGTLVFTGQPGSDKRKEFVFLQIGNTHQVPALTWQGFIDVHENGEKPSPTWEYWLQRYRSGATGAIPVFFLLNHNDEVESLGLAMMYKKAHKHTVHGLIKHTNAVHVTRQIGEAPDLAELILGRGGDTPADMLKGRTSFGLATLERGQDVCVHQHTVVLSSPKASYFPNYVRQTDFSDGKGLKLFFEETERNGKTYTDRAEYKSYMDDDAEIRGWKRYYARKSADPCAAAPGPDTGIKSQTIIHPISSIDVARPLTFRGTLRFHNLLPEELGALVWVLTWGGNGGLRHGLGMGKSIGFGNVSIAIDTVEIYPNDRTVPVPTLDQCRADFEAIMTAWTSKARQGPGGIWRETLQLQALMALANPDLSPSAVELQHMRISPNQFIEAKNGGHVLREPPGITPPRRVTDTKKMKIGSMRPRARQ